MIAPHTGKASFEVGRDVAENLNVVFRKLRFNTSPITFPHKTPDKRMVEMSILAQAQLIQGGLPENPIIVAKADTFKNSSFWSFCRDRSDARQTSLNV